MAQVPSCCRAGVARIDITPSLPCSLAGYYHDRVAKTIHDRLFTGVMVIAGDGPPVVLVSCDLIAMTDEVSVPAAQHAARKHGIPAENVLAFGTHTHEAPEIRDYVVPRDPAYIQRVSDSIAEGIDQAMANLFDATVHVGVSEAKDFSFNKIFRLKDGREVMGGYATGGQAVGRAGPVDASVQTLAVFDSAKNLRGAAINFGCHPDVLAGVDADMVSADWPGVMYANLSAVYGPEPVWLFLQGTCGDIGARDDLPHFRPGQGEVKMIQTGRGVAAAAIMAIERSEPSGDLRTGVAVEDFEIRYVTRTPEFTAMIQGLKEKHESLRARGEKPGYLEEAWVRRAEAWPFDNQKYPIRIRCARIGDMAIAALPGEIFTALGLEIKRYSPFAQTFVVELASCENGVAGYKCPATQANRGAYGQMPTMSRRHEAEAPGQMVDSAIRLLSKLWDEA